MSEPGKSPRQFSSAVKEQIVLRLAAGETIAAAAGETGVQRNTIQADGISDPCNGARRRRLTRCGGAVGAGQRTGGQSARGRRSSTAVVGLLPGRGVDVGRRMLRPRRDGLSDAESEGDRDRAEHNEFAHCDSPVRVVLFRVVLSSFPTQANLSRGNDECAFRKVKRCCSDVLSGRSAAKRPFARVMSGEKRRRSLKRRDLSWALHLDQRLGAYIECARTASNYSNCRALRG